MDPAPESYKNLQQFWDTWRWVILLASGSTIAICIAIVLLVQTAQTSHPIEFSTGSALGVETSTQEQGIVVDVEGAVLTPGIKTVPSASRVEDALSAAGGLTDDADTEYVAKVLNRAQPVVDGMKLYIPRMSESKTSYNNGTSNQTSNTSHNIYDTQTGFGGLAGPMVNINTATLAELDVLPGVGPVTAQKIISNRPYQTLDDLINKKVIGVSLFENLKSRLAL